MQVKRYANLWLRDGRSLKPRTWNMEHGTWTSQNISEHPGIIMINVKKICKIEISKNKINKNNRLSVQNMKIWRFWGAGESGRRGVGSVGHSFN